MSRTDFHDVDTAQNVVMQPESRRPELTRAGIILSDEVDRLSREVDRLRDVKRLAERLAELDAIDTKYRYSYQEQAHFLLTGETPEQRTATAMAVADLNSDPR